MIPLRPDLVLSKGRDPYSDWTPMQVARAQWISQMFQSVGRRIHLRGLHYFIVSQRPPSMWPDGSPYENTESSWEKLCNAAMWARYQGIGDWGDLIDRRHPDPIDFADYESYDSEPLFTASRFSANSLRDSFLTGVPSYSPVGLGTYHLEVWVEKASMNEILTPTITQYGAVLQPLVGESSLERVTGAIQRIMDIGKPTRIFYISDFDPSGKQMPVSVSRKLEFYARDMGLDIRLNPLALTEEQINTFQLPGIPTKASDSRAASFVQQYGDRATELDALEALYPGELANILDAALSPYVDALILEQVNTINDDLRRRFDAILDGHTIQIDELVEGLNALSTEIHEDDETQSLTDDVEYPYPDHEVDEDGDWWLLDTLRDYYDQKEAYDIYKGV